jgi:hypothetical protein
MLAHLAGSLAVPVWTLLKADADWRWMQPDRTDSPWYPTMRLIRQTQPGDWQDVMDDVIRQLGFAHPAKLAGTRQTHADSAQN